MTHTLIERFQNVATIVGNVWWFQPLDAIQIVEVAKAEGIRLLGFDGATIGDGWIQPSMADSRDYSVGELATIADPYEHAKEFIKRRSNADLYFEIVLAR